MICVEEIMPLTWHPYGTPVESETVRQRQIQQRNAERLRRWYEHPQTFGATAGRVLADEHIAAIRE